MNKLKEYWEYFPLSNIYFLTMSIACISFTTAYLLDHPLSGKQFVHVWLAMFIADSMYNINKIRKYLKSNSEANKAFHEILLDELIAENNIKEIYMLYLNNDFQRRVLENKTTEEIKEHIRSSITEDNLRYIVSGLKACKNYINFKGNK